MFEKLLKAINEKKWQKIHITTINSMFNDIEFFINRTWQDGNLKPIRVVLFYSKARMPMAVRVIYKQKNSNNLVSFLKTPMGKVKAEATMKGRKNNIRLLKIYKTQIILCLAFDNENNKNYEAIICE